jgi:hypothetical protein
MTMFLIEVGSLPVPAQGNELSNASLKGISAVGVVVERLSDGAKELGLSKDTIQTNVELKLWLARMRVVTQKEGAKLPWIYISVAVTDDRQAAIINLELRQNALLERNGQFVGDAMTWSNAYLASHPNAEGIRNAIRDGEKPLDAGGLANLKESDRCPTRRERILRP